MESLLSLFKKDNIHELVLIILFIIYIVTGYKTPEPVAIVVDSLAGKVIILVTVIYLFMNANPLLAVLSIFVAFDLIRRSSVATGIDALEKYTPSQIRKNSQFSAMNQFPYTLEQEIVAKMAPAVREGGSVTKQKYKSMSEPIHNASYIHY